MLAARYRHQAACRAFSQGLSWKNLSVATQEVVCVSQAISSVTMKMSARPKIWFPKPVHDRDFCAEAVGRGGKEAVKRLAERGKRPAAMGQCGARRTRERGAWCLKERC